MKTENKTPLDVLEELHQKQEQRTSKLAQAFDRLEASFKEAARIIELCATGPHIIDWSAYKAGMRYSPCKAQCPACAARAWLEKQNKQT